jgi:acyl-CoA synthetase (AMP-forming)/AMP-acid ligase II
VAHWLNLGQNLKVNAKRYPDTVALMDSRRAFTYPEANKRVNRLAHSLLSLGLEKGDKVAVLLENSIEIVEVYLATAKTGLVIVPINFRLVGPEVEYIVNNSDAEAIVVHDEFTPCVEGIRQNLAGIKAENYIVVGGERAG